MGRYPDDRRESDTTQMLERFKLLLRLEEKEGKPKRALRHLALTTHGMEAYAEEKKKELNEVYKDSFKIIKDIEQKKVSNKEGKGISFCIVCHCAEHTAKYAGAIIV